MSGFKHPDDIPLGLLDYLQLHMHLQSSRQCCLGLPTTLCPSLGGMKLELITPFVYQVLMIATLTGTSRTLRILKCVLLIAGLHQYQWLTRPLFTYLLYICYVLFE